MDQETMHGSSYGGWGRRDQLIFATFLQSLSWFVTLAIYSYIQRMPFTLTLHEPLPLSTSQENWMGSIGRSVAYYLVNDLCGINALLIPLFPLVISLKLFLPNSRYKLIKTVGILFFFTAWSPLVMAYWHYLHTSVTALWYLFPGGLSQKIISLMGGLLGAGVMLLLAASFISVIIILSFDAIPAVREWMRKSPVPTHAQPSQEATSHDIPDSQVNASTSGVQDTPNEVRGDQYVDSDAVPNEKGEWVL